MKLIALLSLCIITSLLTGCLESIPIKLGVCKDNVCANVEFTIPASAVKPSAKEVQEVQPVP